MEWIKFMSFGQKWTREDVDRFNEKVAGIVKEKLQSGVKNERIIETAKAIRKMDPSRPKNPSKPLMNKLETAWFNELKARGHQIILCQAIRLKLPDGIWYLPDFIVITATNSEPHVHVVAYETKGPHRFADRGVMKLRLAATTYRWIRFFLVQRENGAWKEREISPT